VAGGATQKRDALHSVGVALGILAGALIILATFLPRLYCPVVELQHNRLLENDEGVAFLVGAGALIVGSIASLRFLRAGWIVIVASLGVIGLTIYSATGPRLLVLSGVAANQVNIYGQVNLGLVLAGFGAFLGFSGGVLLVSQPMRWKWAA
jgi:hypothetical protein